MPGDVTTKVYKTKGSRLKLNAKQTIAHDDVTDGAKTLKKSIDLARRIELTHNK